MRMAFIMHEGGHKIVVAKFADEKAGAERERQTKIRQTLQYGYNSVKRGVWSVQVAA